MGEGDFFTKEKAQETPPRLLRAPFLKKYLLHFPHIRQHDEMSCGITCLAMIFDYFGKTISLACLWDLARVDRSGTSLAGLASAAEHFGCITAGYRLEYDSISAEDLPAIVLWKGFYFVVVCRVTSRAVWVADPGLGLRKYGRDEFIENWNEIMLTVQPTERFAREKSDRTSLQNFTAFVTPHRAIIFEIVLASLVMNVLGLAIPIFTQNIVDAVIIGHRLTFLKLMLLGMLTVAFFRIVMIDVRKYLVLHIGTKIDLEMLTVFYRHLFALPLGHFYEVTGGRLLIDGRDIRDYDLVSLRRSLGYVLQENHLYDATIRENISLWDPEESMERIIEAAECAGAHECTLHEGGCYTGHNGSHKGVQPYLVEPATGQFYAADNHPVIHLFDGTLSTGLGSFGTFLHAAGAQIDTEEACCPIGFIF
jgi:ABC-type bacteriocin/lantibiotic exporter with double-glycine peptidase domain